MVLPFASSAHLGHLETALTTRCRFALICMRFLDWIFGLCAPQFPISPPFANVGHLEHLATSPSMLFNVCSLKIKWCCLIASHFPILIIYRGHVASPRPILESTPGVKIMLLPQCFHFFFFCSTYSFKASPDVVSHQSARSQLSKDNHSVFRVHSTQVRCRMLFSRNSFQRVNFRW